VNPSIELKVTNGLVAEGIAYNDDGVSVLSEVAVAGLSLDDAVNAYIAALAEKGYLAGTEDEPCVLFTVVSGNEANVDVRELVKDAKKTMEDLNIECEVKGAYAGDATQQSAAALGLSAGRYIVINNIAFKEGITAEEAAQRYRDYKMNELMKLLGDDASQEEDGQDKNEEQKIRNPWEGLTDEQKEAIKPALNTFKKEIKDADHAFYKAFKAIRKDYRKQLNDLKKAYKKGDTAEYTAKLNELKKSMLDELKKELDSMEEKIAAAKEKFIQSASSAGAPAQILESLSDLLADKEIKTLKRIEDFVKAFEPKIFETEDDENKAEDSQDTKNKDKKDKNNGNGKDVGKGKGRKHG
jgi:hypothetical protein